LFDSLSIRAKRTLLYTDDKAIYLVSFIYY